MIAKAAKICYHFTDEVELIMNNELTFEILYKSEITDERFSTFFSFLEQAMFKEEYRSFSHQKSLINNDCYKILFCFQNKTVVGVLAFWELDDFVFIEHFIVGKTARNQGVGSKMLKFLKSNCFSTVILEVELPYNEINKRRIAFYERNGFCFNDFEYYQCPLNKGDEPLPLRIMSSPLPLKKEDFEKVKQTLKRTVYNA